MILLRKSLINFFLILLAFITITENSFSIEPSEFVQTTVNRASSALSNNFTREEKIEKLKVIAKETVDIIVQGPGGYDTSLNSTLHGKGIMLNSDI